MTTAEKPPRAYDAGAGERPATQPQPVPGADATPPTHDLAETVARKEARKQRARAEGKQSWAHGFGMFGMVGWSVTVPTVLGIALGIYIDSRVSSGYSWTLMLMIAGLVIGALNAWYWVRKESEGE